MIPATQKQLGKLAHLLAISDLVPYSEQILPNGKVVKTIQPTLEKLRGLSVDQASNVIGLFKTWEMSYDSNDLALPYYMLSQLKIL